MEMKTLLLTTSQLSPTESAPHGDTGSRPPQKLAVGGPSSFTHQKRSHVRLGQLLQAQALPPPAAQVLGFPLGGG